MDAEPLKRFFRVSPAFYPKTFTILKEGYSVKAFVCDVQAALSVAIVSLPLAMALAIAAGCTPDRGLYTAVIAGFLISLLGGSRHQVAGPTAAFVTVIFNVIQQYGYDGLVVATVMAGIMLIAAGMLRLGTIIKYIPIPITTGFTTGIGITLLIGQVKDLLGLHVEKVPGAFLDKLTCFAQNLTSADVHTCCLSLMTVLLIVGLKKWKPKVPGFLMAFLFSAFLVYWLDLDVETIGSKFGDLPHSLVAPVLPHVSWEMIVQLFPTAFTIAFLAGIESLLSCVIADSLAGTKHRSNCELIAQGIGNIASVLFGGIPATGALARTATNVRAGAKTPVAGMLHAVFILCLMYFFAPYARGIPLSCLASILVIVAVNMMDWESVKYMIRATRGDKTVFIATLFLTLFVDITFAIEVGALLAMIFFTRRMIDMTEKQVAKREMHHEDDTEPHDRHADRDPYEHGLLHLPNEIEMIHIAGPFFFGVAARVRDILDRLSASPRVIILDMQNVPFIDASGVLVLKNFMNQAKARKIFVILTSVDKRVKRVLLKMSGHDDHAYGDLVDDPEGAIRLAYEIRDKQLSENN